MARVIIADVEADGLWPSKIHFIWCKLEGQEPLFFDDYNKFIDFVEEHKGYHWVFHNGLGYDIWHINRLIKPNLISPMKVIDTMVVSKLVNYPKYITHSLKEIGQSLGVFKGEFEGPWEVVTQEMIDYGKQDVIVLEAVWNSLKKYILDPEWAMAMRVEHDTAIICWDMSQNGFKFKTDVANAYLEVIKADMTELENNFQESFPPKLVEDKRIKYRTKKDGELFSNVSKSMEEYPLTKVEGDELICYSYQSFDPASPKQRIDVLWDAGWKPTEMTKGYKKFIRENKKKW